MDGESKCFAAIGDGLESISWERLYCIEVQKFSTPDVCASEPEPSNSRFSRVGKPASDQLGQGRSGWERFALIYDAHDRTPAQLQHEVLRLLEGEAGRFRLDVFYWAGEMVTPRTGRLMGRGEDFLYSDNPRGDIVLKSEESIEFEIQNGREEE